MGVYGQSPAEDPYRQLYIQCQVTDGIEVSPDDDYFLARLSFPYLRPEDAAGFVVHDAPGGRAQNEIVVTLEDHDGAPVQVRHALSPKEVARLHRLCLAASLDVRFRPEHQYLVAVNDKGTLIDDLRTRGTTILMSTHYIEEAERLADEVAVMDRGRVIARATPAELIAAHAGTHTAEVYGPPERLTEVRAVAEKQGLAVRPAGPAIAIVGSERASDGAVPDDAVVRAASLEDVFVLLTGADAE